MDFEKIRKAFGRLPKATPEQTTPKRDYGHAVTNAFLDPKLALEYKMAADSHLPWLANAKTLAGHLAHMGQWAGLSGFLGYGGLSELWQNGLIKACIDTIADEMSRKWIVLKENGNETGDKLKRLREACEEYRLRDLFNNAVRWNELFGGCMLYIDTGTQDPQDLLYPLYVSRLSSDLKNFKGFTLIEPVNTFPGVYNSIDPKAKNYFEPDTWWILGDRVHASRLIKFQTSELPQLLKPAYNFYGVPHAQILADYVAHFQQCRVATARALTNFSRTILKTSMFDIMAEDGGADTLQTRLAILSNSSNDGMTGIDKEGEDIAQVNMPISGMSDIVWQALEILCVINKSPAVKTLGVSPSGFSATGDSDFQNWYDHVKSKQEKDISQQIKKCLDILQIHLFGDIDPAITFEFAPLSEDNALAIADYNNRMVEAIGKAYDFNAINEKDAGTMVRTYPDSIFVGLDPVEDNDEEETLNPDSKWTGIQFAEVRNAQEAAQQGLIPRENIVESLIAGLGESRERAEKMIPQPKEPIQEAGDVPLEIENIIR